LKNNKLIIGTRGSKLALWQANFISGEISKYFNGEIELKIIKTTGDKILDSPLAKIGDKGLFVKEIETALLNEDIDLAVHSMKDMPTDVPEGLILAGASKREDPRDAFISVKYKTFNDVPEKGVIATSSLRRRAQVLYNRPDLSTVDVRGNVETRIRKLEEGLADGLIMATAGLKRLGLEKYITEIIDPSIMLPAVGQGCVAIETRTDDTEVREIVKNFSNDEDFTAVKAERALMKHLEGGCQIPIGAFAKVNGDIIDMDAIVASIDGSKLLRERKSGNYSQPEELGIELAETLIAKGAGKILQEIREDNVEAGRNSQI
jgi:hydroxymethylbilane synthase